MCSMRGRRTSGAAAAPLKLVLRSVACIANAAIASRFSWSHGPWPREGATRGCGGVREAALQRRSTPCVACRQPAQYGRELQPHAPRLAPAARPQTGAIAGDRPAQHAALATRLSRQPPTRPSTKRYIGTLIAPSACCRSKSAASRTSTSVQPCRCSFCASCGAMCGWGRGCQGWGG